MSFLFQLRDAAKSLVTVTVPLHVSYVYVTAPTGWGSLEHRTEMQFSFVYDTVLWIAGLSSKYLVIYLNIYPLTIHLPYNLIKISIVLQILELQ